MCEEFVSGPGSEAGPDVFMAPREGLVLATRHFYLIWQSSASFIMVIIIII